LWNVPVILKYFKTPSLYWLYFIVVTGNTLLISHTDLQRNCLSRVTRLWNQMWLILSTSIYMCEIHNYFYNDKNIVSIKWKFFGYSVFTVIDGIRLQLETCCVSCDADTDVEAKRQASTPVDSNFTNKCFDSKPTCVEVIITRHRFKYAIHIVNPLTPTVAILVRLHPVPDRVKPSFVIFEIRALWRSALSVRVTLSPERQSVRMSKITNDGLIRSGTGYSTAK